MIKITALCVFLLIINITYAHSTEVILSNGDILNGEVLENKNGLITFKHSALGVIVLADAVITPIKIEQSQAVDTGMFNTGILKDWQRSVEIGLKGSEGNSRDMDINVGTQLKYENDYKRWNIEAAYNSSEDSGETSKSDFFTKFSRDYLTPGESRFYFSEGRYDWDEFEDWDYRISFGGGLGEQLIEKDHWSVLGRLGLGLSKKFGGEDERWVPEGLVAVESDWAITKRNALIFKNSLYPSFSEPGEFRNITELNWMIGLDDFKGMDFKLGFHNEFDSNASGDSRKNDFKYNLSLVFSL